jgi:hypothetical protein
MDRSTRSLALLPLILLFISLTACGGFERKESAPVNKADSRDGREGTQALRIPFAREPDAALESAILDVSPDYTPEIVEIGKNEARYLYSRIDLNGDGRKEVFVYLLGSIFCGTGGCNLLLFRSAGGGYTLIDTFPISRLPVVVSAAKTAGWRNLFRLEYGGGAPASYVRHTFDGEKYVKQARLPADTPPEGARVLAGEFTFYDGIPLAPLD